MNKKNCPTNNNNNNNNKKITNNIEKQIQNNYNINQMMKSYYKFLHKKKLQTKKSLEYFYINKNIHNINIFTMFIY